MSRQGPGQRAPRRQGTNVAYHEGESEEKCRIDGKKLCLSSLLYESKPVKNKDIYTVYHIVLEHHDPHGQYGIYVGEKNPILCETLSYYWYKKNN